MKRKLLTGVMVILIVASVVLALYPPLVLERIVNRLADGQSVPFFMALLYFAALAVSALTETAQNAVITVFGQRMTHELRKNMCAKLSRLPASYFTKHDAGEITARFVNDVDAVDSLFTNGIVSMFADGCTVISIIGVIFWKSRGLGIVMLVVTPLLFALTRVFQKRMLKAQLENRGAVSRVNNHIPETIRNIRTIIHFLKKNIWKSGMMRISQGVTGRWKNQICMMPCTRRLSFSLARVSWRSR